MAMQKTREKTEAQKLDAIMTLSGDLVKAIESWVQNNLTPDEVFKIETLEQWAKDNGFVWK